MLPNISSATAAIAKRAQRWTTAPTRNSEPEARGMTGHRINCLPLRRRVLGEVFVAVGVHDGLRRIADGQALGCALTIGIVLRACDHREVGSFMNQGSSL